MALTRHSVRTCFLWKGHSEEFGAGTRLSHLWEAFLVCLEDIQSPDMRSGPAGVDASVRTFLQKLLEAADDCQEAQRLAEGLRTRSSMADILEDWKASPHYDGAHAAVFREPVSQGAAAFFLGQLAFIFGRLRLAKEFVVEAYLLFQTASAGEKGRVKPLCLRILEFLTVTLLLEISFHSEGYDTLRDEHGEPQTQRILVQLSRRKDYLQDFPTLAELGIEVRNGGKKRAGPGDYLLEYFWLPIPRDKDTEPLDLGDDLASLPPLSLAYILSRRNRAGMLFFRYRDWRAAEEQFSFVAETIRRQYEAGKRDSVLAPLEHEAALYLGRLQAQAYEFDQAELLIGKAHAYFELIHDEFAVNKAIKARAELAFHRSRWPEAERLFLQVWRFSRDRGYGHDEAAAEMFLGKIKSMFGFQRDAINNFATANRHFRQYDVLRETVSCLFWQTAAEARRLELKGHSRSNVVEARALMKVYRRLFEGRPTDDRTGLTPGGLLRLREALRDKREPDVNEAMLDLRLGHLPPDQLVNRLETIASAMSPDKSSWPQTAHARLMHELLRIIRLQSLEQRQPAATSMSRSAPLKAYDEKRLQRLCIRDRVLSALEGVVWSSQAPEPYLPASCLALQEALSQSRSMRLGGGLIPFLVELSQFFVDRDCFVALILLLVDALHETILKPEAATEPRLDPEELKAVYRGLTKYLVLERNFYLGPPTFEGTKSPKLWAELQRLHGSRDWTKEHAAVLQGRYGINYPTVAVGFGWVETLGAGGARLQIAWVDNVVGRPLRHEDFQPLEVPEEIATRGHATQPYSLVVLLGRQGVPDDEGSPLRPWTAHRIPLDIPREDLFQSLDEPPGTEPILEMWDQLFRRLTGTLPATCDSPEVSASEVEARYAELARQWFSDRLPAEEFEHVFQIPLQTSPPPPPMSFVEIFLKWFSRRPVPNQTSPVLAVVAHFPHPKPGPPSRRLAHAMSGRAPSGASYDRVAIGRGD